jgi:hypothetical protein
LGAAVIQFRQEDRQDEVAAPGPRSSSRLWKTAAAIVLGIFVVIGVLAVFFPSKFKHQFDISFVRQPESYTQLFFNDPSTLPTNLKADREYKFSFTVTNDQGNSETDQYVVTVTHGKDQKVVGKGSLVIGDDRSTTKAIEFKPTTRKSRYLIKVTLSGTDDVIQFYGETS